MAAGLELLYMSVAQNLSAAQDALLCFIHWEMVVHGYRCLGTGDQPGENERKSEMLPSGWNSNKELYSLRYKSQDGISHILLKAIMVENTMILNAMKLSIVFVRTEGDWHCPVTQGGRAEESVDAFCKFPTSMGIKPIVQIIEDPKLEQVVDVTLKVADYVNSDCLDSFEKVYKNSAELSSLLLSRIISAFTGPKEKPRAMRDSPQSHDPFRSPPHHPHTNPQPNWPDPLGPFAAGGADLDPLGGRSGGGMIVDPLRSGFPRAGFDSSSGILSHLPPGAVPPGARFDPFGPMSSSRPGPDPDHLSPPGYDDMFM